MNFALPQRNAINSELTLVLVRKKRKSPKIPKVGRDCGISACPW